MCRRNILKEIKDYLSIFIFSIFIILSFSNTMSFADGECESYGINRCRENKISFSQTPDYDGNVPVVCGNVELEFFDFPKSLTDKGDYNFYNRNEWCLWYAVEAAELYSLASLVFAMSCQALDQSDKIFKHSKNYKKMAQKAAIEGLKRGAKAFITGPLFAALIDPYLYITIEYGIDTVYEIKTLASNTAFGVTNPGMAATAGVYNAACIVGYAAAVVPAFMFIIKELTKPKYDSANDYINEVKLCGHDWNNFAYTHDIMSTSTNNKEWYPKYGGYSGSYEHKLNNCFQLGIAEAEAKYGGSYCDDVYKEGENKICDGDAAFCSNITYSSRSRRNRVYREMLYGGKEFTVSDDDTACYDPRLFAERGYYGSDQRYYFRGKDSAQYNCEKFSNYKGSGCVLGGTRLSFSRFDVARDPAKFETCRSEFEKAYQCCEKRRINSACIYDNSEEYNRSGTACFQSSEEFDLDNKPPVCQVSGAKFVAFKSDENATKVCVKNVNYCPYVFNVSGGINIKQLYCDGVGDNCSDEKDQEAIYIYNTKTKSSAYAQIKNFCFYEAHCTTIGLNSAGISDSDEEKYLSLACSTFVGDSQNLPYSVVTDIDGNVIDKPTLNYDFNLSQYRGLTAPVAQCFKETIYNLFKNKAARSKCTESSNEELNEEGLCGVDTYGPPESIRNNVYEYKTGDTLPDSESIFLNIQKRLRNIVKLVAVLALIVIGFMFLQKGDLDIFDVKKPRSLIFGMMKFAIVFYFAIGDAWQTKFYDWLNSGSQYLYYESYKISSIGYENYRTLLCTVNGNNNSSCECKIGSDGNYVPISPDISSCPQNGDYAIKFFIFKSKNGSEHQIPMYKYSPNYDGCYFADNKYPAGKEYIAVFDSFDCKLSRYFGYGPEINLPGIINTIVLSLIFSFWGIIIMFLGLIFFIYILRITVKALYLFLLPMIAINIIIFLTPIILPISLFKKYKNYFDKWVESLIAYSTQFIFAIILAGFVLGNLDKVYLGSATYYNHDEFGRYPKVDCSSAEKFDSLICVFTVNSTLSTEIWPSRLIYDMIGIGVNVNSQKTLYGNANNIFKGFMVFVYPLFKGILITFIFVHLFDQIPTIASSLVGGSKKIDKNINIGKQTGKNILGAVKTSARVGKYAAKTAISLPGKAARAITGKSSEE